MKQKQIDIFAFIEDGNLGDPVIGETSKYLVEKICAKNNINANVRLHALFPPKDEYTFVQWLRRKCLFPKSNAKRRLLFWILCLRLVFDFKFKKYYSDRLKDSDLVIFGGGGMLKYYTQAFWASDYCIIDYCDKHNIPVYFNANGIEGYDENNFTSRLIKSLLEKECVKGITTRDDIDALNKFCPNKENKVVGDPALYSKELYGSEKKTDIVGINTIRPGIFNVNGFNIQDTDLIDFYCEMIKRLDKDNIKWQLFTNGIKTDNDLAKAVLRKLEIEPTEQNLLPRPQTSIELAHAISRYKGVIAGRMHAHIIATSYGIPTVGQIWNEKIKWFSKHIGAEERFFYPNDMNNYDLVYSTFKKALEEGNGKLNVNKLKEDAMNELESFVVKMFN